jgi:RNA polymerase sigma-54 factor
MALTASIEMVPRHQLLPSPQLIAFASMLALPGVELELAITRELEENPCLLVDDWSSDRVDAARLPSTVSEAVHDEDEPEPEPQMPTSWRDALTRDLRMELPAASAPLAAFVVECLNEHGFLIESDTELARLAGASRRETQRVVRTLREIGPAGVGARDVRDCLLLQLDRIAERTRPPRRAARIIGDHLEDLARGRTAVIAAALEIDPREVTGVRAWIRSHLRPWPALGPDGPANAAGQHIRPDVVIAERPDAHGSFEVDIPEAHRINLRVDPELRRLAHSDGADGLQELVRKADLFVLRLRQRWSTLRRIATLLAERERGFLLFGATAYQPLTRAAVAAELGLHEATISRAVAGKYVQLPSSRVMAMSEFFDSATAVRETLRSIIAAEPRPLSDADLGRALERAGHSVARRTVAKYRLSLGVLSSAAR